jgi:hypothetical protein
MLDHFIAARVPKQPDAGKFQAARFFEKPKKAGYGGYEKQ